MNLTENTTAREERRQELLAMWSRGKKEQAAVQSMCHNAMAPGEPLRAGMSIIDVILDHEFGKQEPSSEESQEPTSEAEKSEAEESTSEESQEQEEFSRESA